MTKLDVRACGIALGLVAAIGMFVLGTINILFFWVESYRRVVNILYLGYPPTLVGVIFGALWAFVCAYVLGACFASLYNRIVKERDLEDAEKIKQLAHQIWVKKGRPENSSDQDWKQASKLIKGE